MEVLKKSVLAALILMSFFSPVAPAYCIPAETTATAPLPPESRTGLEAQTAEVEQLRSELLSVQREIERLSEFKISLETRLEVTTEQLARTFLQLEKAENNLNKTQEQYSGRIRGIYKAGAISFLEVILKASNLKEFLVMVKYLSYVLSHDRKLLAEIEKETRNIKNYQKKLNEQKKYQSYINNEYRNQLSFIESKKKTKQELLKAATVELKQFITQEEDRYTFRLNQAMSASYSLKEKIEIVFCQVEPYFGEIFWVSERMPRKYRSKQSKMEGVASWYGPGFHGKRTASGEVFNQNDFTCAHKTLPLGSYLLVSYKDKKIVVKVNDRGPFVAGREFDLSKAAAYYLGFTGIATVQAELVEPVF